MRAALRRDWSRFEAEHEDWISDVLVDWLADEGIDCVSRVLSKAKDHTRKRARQARLRAEHRGAVNRGTVRQGADDDSRARRFSQTEERELRSAVLDLCLDEYRQAWGKDWEDTRAAAFHKATAKADVFPVAEDKSAREVLEQVRRVQRLAGGTPAGPAAVQLASVDTSSLDAPRLWLDPSELRRFVARIYWNAAVSIVYGCTRRPPGEDPAEGPNPRWVTRPNDREMTVIWLLAGGWPTITPKRWEKGITARELIRSQQKTIEAARAEAERWVAK